MKQVIEQVHRWDKRHECETITDEAFGIIDEWQQERSGVTGAKQTMGKWKAVIECQRGVAGQAEPLWDAGSWGAALPECSGLGDVMTFVSLFLP